MSEPPITGLDKGEFLAGLDDADAAALLACGARRRWPRHATLFNEGDRSDHVVILLSGRAKVSSFAPTGGEVVLAVRGPGALIGELAAIDGGDRSATVSALEPLEALVIPPAEFTGFLQLHGRATFLLLRMLSERLRDADRKRIEFGTADITGRVAGRLVELAERFGEPEGAGVRVAVPLSQEELAGWTGASREAVSRALRSLRSRGWIDTGRRSVTIHNLDALRHRAR